MFYTYVQYILLLREFIAYRAKQVFFTRLKPENIIEHT